MGDFQCCCREWPCSCDGSEHVHRCLPRAMDLGHCTEAHEWCKCWAVSS